MTIIVLYSSFDELQTDGYSVMNKSAAAHGDCFKCDKSKRNKSQRDRASRERTIKQKSQQKQINRKTQQSRFKRPNPAGRPKACQDAKDKASCMRSYRNKKNRQKKRREMDKNADVMFTMDVDDMNVEDALKSFEEVCAELGIDDDFDDDSEEDSEDDYSEDDDSDDDDSWEDLGEEDGGEHLARTNNKLRNTLRKNKGQRARNRARTVKKNPNSGKVHSRFKGKSNAAGRTRKTQINQQRWRKKNPGKVQMYQRRRKRASAEVVAQIWLEKKQ
tara:strand:+ start:824 stop:1645 length:822 start_codon:yes stop_codon:yes gene_type:complete